MIISDDGEICLNSYITNREHVPVGSKVDPISLPSIAVSECSILPVHLWPRRSIQSMSSFRSGNMYRPPSAGSYYMDMEDKISVELDSDSDWSNAYNIDQVSRQTINDDDDDDDDDKSCAVDYKSMVDSENEVAAIRPKDDDNDDVFTHSTSSKNDNLNSSRSKSGSPDSSLKSSGSYASMIYKG